METLTLQPAKGKWLMTLLTAAVLLWSGVPMIQHGSLIVGWAITILFGYLTLFSISMLIPGMNGVTLTPEGFSLKAMGRTQAVWKIKWRDVTRISVVDLKPRDPKALLPGPEMKMVGITFTPAARAEMPAARIAKLDNFRQKYNCDVALPDAHGLGVEQITALLNEWRARYATA